jgi:hypothetical protein
MPLEDYPGQCGEPDQQKYTPEVQSLIVKAIKMGYDDGWADCNDGSASETPHVTVEDVLKGS